jgi:hypothetical protein
MYLVVDLVRHAYLAAVAVLACLNVGLLVSADGKNISPDASPSLDRGPTYECVKAQGYNPDGFIFVYRHGRTGANGRGTDLVRVAANEGRRKGMALSRLDIGLPGEREISVLKDESSSFMPKDGSRQGHILRRAGIPAGAGFPRILQMITI